MNKPKLIGVTGGIGSGKSTICKIFEILGVSVYYADDSAKQLMLDDPELRKNIIEIFGTDAYKDEALNRQEIASQAFSDPQKLNRLNEAVHPAVKRDFENWIKANEAHSNLMKEAALLFETGSYKELDATILVIADEDVRVERILNRDPHRTKEDVKNILDKQFSDEQKRLMADYVIDNSGNVSVIQQALEVYKQLT